ncbi:MAG: hypothetical protein LBV04_04745 [Deferribacteraceae bacterium]|jgi:hypothetical protein|nr:hypothetical protein [Deferribacteraceae bacterium]
MGLFKPAWMSNNQKKEDNALKEVAQETNQEILATIAKTGLLETVNRAAARELSDPLLVAQVLKDYDSRLQDTKSKPGSQTNPTQIELARHQKNICQILLDKITDQTLLQNIVLNNDEYSYDVREAAALSQNLTDISILLEITRRATGFSDILKHVENKLKRLLESETDQTILAQIALSLTPDDGYYAQIVLDNKYLTDSSLLANIVECAQNDTARGKAENKLAEGMDIQSITDQKALISLVKTSVVPAVRIKAVAKITDQSILQGLMQKECDAHVRCAITKSVVDPILLAQIARDDRDVSVRETAAQKIIDQPVLLDIALNDQSVIVRNTAAKNLKEPEKLSELIKEGKDVLPVVFYRYLAALTGRDPSDYETSYPLFKMDISKITDLDLLVGALQNIVSWGRLSVDRRAAVAEVVAPGTVEPNIIKLVQDARTKFQEDRDLDEHLRSIEARVGGSKAKIKPSDAKQKDVFAHTEDTPFVNDLEFIIQSLKATERIKISGQLNGTLLRLPSNTKRVQAIPSNGDNFYRMYCLYPELTGMQLIDRMSTPNSLFTGPFLDQTVVHNGFPNLCLKCGAPVERFELLVGLKRNAKNFGGLVIEDLGNTDGVWESLQNDKHFIAIPCCKDHALAESFFFFPNSGMHPFFTNDRDIAARCMTYNKRSNGNIMMPVSFRDGRMV